MSCFHPERRRPIRVSCQRKSGSSLAWHKAGIPSAGSPDALFWPDRKRRCPDLLPARIWASRRSNVTKAPPDQSAPSRDDTIRPTLGRWEHFLGRLDYRLKKSASILPVVKFREIQRTAYDSLACGSVYRCNVGSASKKYSHCYQPAVTSPLPFRDAPARTTEHHWEVPPLARTVRRAPGGLRIRGAPGFPSDP